MIDDHENKTIYDFSSETLRADCPRGSDVERQKPFSGGVFYLQPYHWNSVENFFIGFEDASLVLYNVDEEKVIEWHQREYDRLDDPPALMAIDSRPVLTSDGVEARQFVIADPKCVYVLYYDPANQSFHTITVLKELIK